MTLQNSSANLGIGSKITTYGNKNISTSNYGVFAGRGELTASGLTITTEGGIETAGIWSYGTQMIDLKDTKLIVSEGVHSYGILSGAGKVDFHRGSIDVKGIENAYGIWLADGSKLLSNDLTLIVTSANSSGNEAGIVAFTRNESYTTRAELSGNISIDAATALAALNKGSELIGDGKMTLTGDVIAQGGKVDLTMRSGSLLTGTVFADPGQGTSQIDFDMTESKWKMTGSSRMNELALQNSTIEFATDLNNSGYGSLLVTDLSGSGIFAMRTNIEGEDYGVHNQGDLLVISGNASGHHQVFVHNQGSERTNGNERLMIIQTTVNDDGINSFALVNLVEAGAYEYQLRRNPNDPTDWELFSTGGISSTGNTVNLHGGNYLLHQAEQQNLFQRLGELRNSSDGFRKNDVWGRIYGGKLVSHGDGVLRKFDMDYQGIQMGIDRLYPRSDSRGTTYLGGFLGYTKGDLSYLGGSGDIDSISAGVYGSYFHHNGFFADLVLKYGAMKSEYDVVDSAGAKVSGEDVKSDVFGISLELGRRYHLNRQTQEGFYIEPQAQLSFGHFTGGGFTATNGLHMQVEDFDSLIVRLGGHVGYEIKNRKNPINIYLKGYWMKEVAGKIDFRLNGSLESTSYEDTWLAYGLGISAQIKERHHLYLDFEHWSGGRVEQKWAINGGYRYRW